MFYFVDLFKNKFFKKKKEIMVEVVIYVSLVVFGMYIGVYVSIFIRDLWNVWIKIILILKVGKVY